MFTHLQWRIAAGYVGLMSLVLLGLGLYLNQYLRAEQLSALENQLQRQARLVADHAQERGLTGDPGPDALAKRLGATIGARVTIISRDGTVLGDSDQDPGRMDNHGARPEVVEALRAGSGQSRRHSATVERDLLYVAVPMGSGEDVVGVARVALPLSQVHAAVDRVVAAVVAALAITAVLATGLAVLFARFAAAPVETFTRAVQRIAAGNLDHRLPMPARGELQILARTFSDLATKLQSQIQALEDERGRLAGVLQHMADGVVIIDSRGDVRLINPAGAQLLSVPPDRAEGRSVMTVLRNHELGEVVRRAAAGTEEVSPNLVELGRGCFVQALASRIPATNMAGWQVLLILQDVSEMRRAETVRREFVANVSHELRTPVAALKALVETLEDGALNDPQVAPDFLARMHVEVDGLAQLLGELLELSRIESGALAVHPQPADLYRLAAAAAERLRPQAERQQVVLNVLPPTEAPEVADPERIQQVVVNLVHNAIKFTPPGGAVAVAVGRRDGDAAVTVADTGVGIPPDALPRLFERFYKADRARAGAGTGLGLAIAKHLVQAHGGRIWAESPGEGSGATFTFTLPSAPVSTRP